jgi:hypothetical protein
MRILGFALVTVLLLACDRRVSVYEQPLPDPHESPALTQIGGELRPEDRRAWSGIVAHIMSRSGGPLRSKTVGEAIARWKAQSACLKTHARGLESVGADVKARDREIDAYNDCLEMDI